MSSETRARLGRWVSKLAGHTIANTNNITHRGKKTCWKCHAQRGRKLVVKHVGLIANLTLQNTLLFLSVLIPRDYGRFLRSFVRLAQPSNKTSPSTKRDPVPNHRASRELPTLSTLWPSATSPEQRHILMVTRRTHNRGFQNLRQHPACRNERAALT